MIGQCECADHNCPAHQGGDCNLIGMVETLYCTDMHDETGTKFCRACADDACESGVFCSEQDKLDADEHDDLEGFDNGGEA